MPTVDDRLEYSAGELDPARVPADPVSLFTTWLEEARASSVPEPNAMVLATVSAESVPSARVVLLREFSAEGFVFYTNYSSQKGEEIAENSNVTAVFYWGELERQVRVSGKAERVSRAESEAYFNQRPRNARIGAIASAQSREIEDRKALEEAVRVVEQQLGDEEPECPEDWGGYRIVPKRLEFWQGRKSRLHDRLAYTSVEKGQWTCVRLQP